MQKLISLVKGKKVQICGHWDTDGVASAAMLYHLLKPYCLSVTTITKGKPFLVLPSDIKDGIEVVICADIVPTIEIMELPWKPKVVYIDHHPNPEANKFDFALHNPSAQSCTLLIFEGLARDTNDPYIVFLALIGFFGDRGCKENIPPSLMEKAKSLIPEMVEERTSQYDGKTFLEIERYASLLNTGKRLHWSGDVPLELLKSIDSYKPFTTNFHPLARELQYYKEILKEAYKKEVQVQSTAKFDYVLMQDNKNIQGVIAARCIGEKPILVMNIKDGEVIGSMRVPESCSFDAGKFLQPLNEKIESFLGGGHEKAAGFTMNLKDLPQFIEYLKNY